MQQAEQKSWTTWGNHVVVDVVPGGLGLVTNVSTSITHVTMRHPIAWRFYMSAKILDVEQAFGATLVGVAWNVRMGLGRSVIDYPVGNATTRGFLQMTFAGAPIPLGAAKWTDRAPAEPLEDGVVGSLTPAVDTLVAQTIDLDAVVSYAMAPGHKPLRIQLDAQFAPVAYFPDRMF